MLKVLYMWPLCLGFDTCALEQQLVVLKGLHHRIEQDPMKTAGTRNTDASRRHLKTLDPQYGPMLRNPGF